MSDDRLGFGVTSAQDLKPNANGRKVDILPQHAALAEEAQIAYYKSPGNGGAWKFRRPRKLADIPEPQRVRYCLIKEARGFARAVPDDGSRAMIVEQLGFSEHEARSLLLVISVPVS